MQIHISGRPMFALQRAKTVAQVHQYCDACILVHVPIENDTPMAKTCRKLNEFVFDDPNNENLGSRH